MRSKEKDYVANYNREYRRSHNGIAVNMHSGQCRRSRRKNYPPPTYSSDELLLWIISQDNYIRLYNDWVGSGYNKWAKPSVDRINDYKPYTLDNLQLMTWQQNYDKGNTDAKNGINNKRSRAVIGVNKVSGQRLRFHSISEAGRHGNFHATAIGRNCRNVGKSHAGYVWHFENKQ